MLRHKKRKRLINTIPFTLALFVLAWGSFLSQANLASAQASDPAVEGCAVGGESVTPPGGFNIGDYTLDNIDQAADGSLTLSTGVQALDPNNIVIPFEQDVYSVFMLEGAGYRSDLGWFIKGDADTKFQATYAKSTDQYATDNNGIPFADLLAAGVTVHYLYRYIQDDQETSGCCAGGDGVLDIVRDDENDWDNDGSETDTLHSGSTASITEAELTDSGYTTISSEIPGFVTSGQTDPRDMRKHMGQIQNADGSVTLPKFAAGTEIVFFIHANGDVAGKTFYSKDTWSLDTWNPSSSSKRNVTLAFDLSIAAPEQGGPAGSLSGGTWTQGFMPIAARDRLGNPDSKGGYPANGYFDVRMTGTKSFPVVRYQKYNHFMLAAPPNDPNKWIIGVEDLIGGGDADFNDLVFMMERMTGGAAELAPAASPSASLTADEYITSVTIKVDDEMPGASCGQTAGATQIQYFVSIDDGVNWTEVDTWDIIRTPDANGADVANWSYGNPEVTHRQRTIDFASLGVSGNRLLWKGVMLSSNEACVPKVVAITLSYEAAEHKEFSRSAPTVLANVIYSAAYETPASTWTDKTLRGHFTSTRLYDPVASSAGYAITENWDAGAELGGSAAGAGGRAPNSRNILYPDVTLSQVNNEVLATGDGTAVTFTGTLTNFPIQHSTVEIYGVDGVGTPETFVDEHSTDLTGSLLGTGTINRYTGEYELTFTNPPATGTDVTADYVWYTTSSVMLQFNAANITKEMLDLDNTGYVDGTGFHYTYDFNNDGAFDEADADWLVNWVIGYSDGTDGGTKKEWVLAAVDHSAPAVVGSPGIQGWYYGSAIDPTIRDSFDTFRCQQRTRKTVAYLGVRDGQIHAFNAGKYRPYYIDESLLDAGDPCGSGSEDALNKFRGNAAIPGDTGAVNPLTKSVVVGGTTKKFPYYPGPNGNWTAAASPTINRGYYEWPDVSGPDYGDGSELNSMTMTNLMSKFKNNQLEQSDRAYVDASPTVAHVQFTDGSWHTVLVVAQGNGGHYVTGFDITDPDNPTFLWEFSDPDLFRSTSSPSIGAVGRLLTSSGPVWAVFFVSGVNSDATRNPSIYMINMQTGALVQRIELDTAGTDGLGGTPSGQPALIDSDGNGYSDRFFIGTDKGFMYKGTLPDSPDASSGAIQVCTFYETPLGSVSGVRLAIYASPAVTVNNTVSAAGVVEYHVKVFFGTSSSPYQTDDVGDQFYFFAIEDTDDKGACTLGDLAWQYALPAGHQVFAAAFATAGRVYFGTTTAETEDPCAPAVAASGGGTGMTMVVDAETGTDVIAPIDTGNVSTTPVVDDEHLYIKDSNGNITGFGGNTFQNETKQGGFSEAVIDSWSEILQ